MAFFKEVGDHDWRVSLRSKGSVDIGAIARANGGGGHTNAAGCSAHGRARRRCTSNSASSSLRRSQEGLRSRKPEACKPKTPSPQDPRTSDGVLVVDKTEGPTSHDVVTLARRALGVSRIGHTGTLDPMATGVLPLVIGRATRLAQFLTASDKTYEATIAFGRTTDTYDASGKIVTTSRSASDARRARCGARAGSAARSSRRRRPIPRRTSTASGRTSSRAQGQDQRRTQAPKAVAVTGQAARDPVVRRRHGAARDAGHRGLLRALAGARPRRRARMRRGADGAAPDAVRRVRTRSGGAAGRRAAGAARIAGGAAGAVPASCCRSCPP